MATAFADLYGFTPAFEGQVGMTLSVTYVGTDVTQTGGLQTEYVNVTIAADASPVDMRNAMASAVRRDAQERGLTIPTNGVNMPTFQKG